MPYIARVIPILLTIWTALAAGLPAHAEEVSIPAKVVGGVVVVRGSVPTPRGRLEAHFLLDLGSPAGLIVPADRSRVLRLDEVGTSELSLGQIELPRVRVTENDLADVVGPLTADNAVELSQIPVLGILGLGAFADRHVQLDLNAGVLRLVDRHPDGPNVISAAWLEGAAGPVFDLDSARAGIRMLQGESLVSAEKLNAFRVGRPNPVRIALGPVDLLASDAFRPAAIDLQQPRPDILLGVRFLSYFRTTFHLPSRTTSFEPLSKPAPPPGEQEYFLAVHRNDADGIIQFVRQYPDHRLVAEAALALLQTRLSRDDADPAKLDEAVRLLAATFPAQRRSARLLGLVDQLMNYQGSRVAVAIDRMLAVASETASQDLDSRAVYEIHARRGLLAMRNGDLREARRLLVAAAYGMPGDPRVNQWLGDLYRKSDQPLHAWSRYVEACLDASRAPVGAFRGLDELQRDESFLTAFKIDDAELMLEGRAPHFGPRRSRPAGEVPSVVAVELFTDDAARGCVGPQLAFDGLRQYYANTPVVFLAYHFGPAGNTELAAARARFYELKSLPALLADGQPIPVTAAGPEEAQSLFESTDRRLSAMTAPGGAPIIIAGAVRNGRLEVSVELKDAQPFGRQPDVRLFTYVVQRRIFALGGNGIAMHYATVLASLTSPQGHAIDLELPTRAWNIASPVETLIGEIESQAERHAAGRPAASMRFVAPNVGEWSVVALVQDPSTRKIVAAGIADITIPENQP